MAETELPATFQEMFLREFDFVCRSLRRLGVRTADLHDVAQELFLAVYRAWDTYDPDRSTRAWLFAFAMRFAANYRRLGWHRVGALEHEVATRSDAPDEALAARQMVLRGLEALDLDKRAVLVMHDLEQIPAPEIAGALSIPLNTIYSRLRLARAAFRAAVSGQTPGVRS